MLENGNGNANPVNDLNLALWETMQHLNCESRKIPQLIPGKAHASQGP